MGHEHKAADERAPLTSEKHHLHLRHRLTACSAGHAKLAQRLPRRGAAPSPPPHRLPRTGVPRCPAGQSERRSRDVHTHTSPTGGCPAAVKQPQRCLSAVERPAKLWNTEHSALAVSRPSPRPVTNSGRHRHTGVFRGTRRQGRSAKAQRTHAGRTNYRRWARRAKPLLSARRAAPTPAGHDPLFRGMGETPACGTLRA